MTMQKLGRNLFERFDEEARSIVLAAVEEARGVDANHVRTEHLLLAAVAANEEFCAGLGILRSDVLAGLFDEGGSSPEGDIPFTPRTVRALELASQCGDVGPNEILVGLLDEGLESRGRDSSVLSTFLMYSRAPVSRSKRCVSR
jgi:hypothetical protein